MSQEKLFVPKPGQVDYTNIRWCPVINCVVKYGKKILILKRSERMRLYPGYWNGVSGFLDDNKSLEEKVTEEVCEEIGINEYCILSIKLGEIFDQNAEDYKKTWIVHPVLVEIDTDQITPDWESQEYAWIIVEELKNYKLLPGFELVVTKLSSLM